MQAAVKPWRRTRSWWLRDYLTLRFCAEGLREHDVQEWSQGARLR
jgi:hypothetical protein